MEFSIPEVEGGCSNSGKMCGNLRVTRWIVVIIVIFLAWTYNSHESAIDDSREDYRTRDLKISREIAQMNLERTSELVAIRGEINNLTQALERIFDQYELRPKK